MSKRRRQTGTVTASAGATVRHLMQLQSPKEVLPARTKRYLLAVAIAVLHGH